MDRVELEARLAAAAPVGMTQAAWAALQPDRAQIYDPHGRVRTFGEVNADANRLVRLMRAHGLRAGDAVALVCSNRAEFVEVLAATQRSGLRLTPVNWHLTPDEIAYVVDDCDAKALFAEARVPGMERAAAACPGLALKVAIGGAIPGFLDYDAALAGLEAGDIADPVLGTSMLYTSGTTGRPKGVHRPAAPPASPSAMRTFEHAAYDARRHVQMCAGPAYHAAPLLFDVRASMSHGLPLVLMGKWDSEHVLRTIEERRVTHMHMVPIMFQRLLALPEAVKAKYDLSSLRYVIHGAAPCPPEVKQAMVGWWGPIIHEYYGGSESGPVFYIPCEEWLQKPGSVGRRPESGVRILDAEDRDQPAGEAGTIYFELPQAAPFEYYKAPEKTAASRRDRYFTMGDEGYFDADGYLYLTGRSAETIISGGVNIYPQEIDNVLIQHPAVADSATVGVPSEEWGESVQAVILLEPGHAPSDALAREILDFGRARLPAYKVPRGLDFAVDLPRSEAGKIQRHKVRAPYWAGRARQI